MNCPRCGFRSEILAVNDEELPALAPIVCESCGQVSIYENGTMRIPTPSQMRAIKESRAWRDFIEPISKIIRDSKAPAADRTKMTMSDGSPVTADHRELRPDGQQKGYVVLSAEERSKGFVRPFRDTYVHKACSGETIMGRGIAETYARDPGFYGATFCCHCGTHRPLVEFVWKGTEEQVGS